MDPRRVNDPLAPSPADAAWYRDNGYSNDETRALLANAPVEHRGELRMAERFTREHSDRLRHVHGIGWHQWSGHHWRPDDDRVDLRSVVATTKNALRELEILDKEARESLFKDTRRIESARAMEGLLKIASAMHPLSVPSKALDADPYLFNTPAGTLDLHSGKIRDNDRADMITKVAGAGPAETPSTEWDAFLERVLPDPELRAFVQRIIGYAMLGKVTEHVMPIFTGTGANGKGTLRDALMHAFGDYAIEVDPALLMESKYERHGSFKMRLRGSRLVFCSETEKGHRFAEATMKRLVGGDPIEANFMHKNPITFDPSHTLVMLTNHLPAVSGDDPAIWRRLLVVPFNVVIPEPERDPELPGRLRNAAPQIIAWAYEGWADYQRNGLAVPDAVRERTLAYQADSDALGRFLAERTLGSPHAHIGARELFTAWAKWYRGSGEQAEAMGSEVAFAASMRSRGFERKKTSRGYVYRALLLLAEESDDSDTEPDNDDRYQTDGWSTPPLDNEMR